VTSRGAALLCALVLAAGCDREERRLQDLAASGRRPSPMPQSPLQPGTPGAGEPSAGGGALTPRGRSAPGNAWDVSQGQQLYVWFNCAGCHGPGGGGNIGPPLMDSEWRYGSSPEQIYQSIAGGRPNGMPAFGGKIPEQQIWQLVAYVRALSSNVPLDNRPGRPDALSTRPPPSVQSPQRPNDAGRKEAP
jgi:cytochrome c oxidase cbb3-type subunit 3